jgi:hypothetical protein
LKRDEDLGLMLVTNTAHHSCAFTFAIDLIADGKQQTVTVDNHGQPFRVSALYWIEDPDGVSVVDYVKYRIMYSTSSGMSLGDDTKWVRWKPRDYVRAVEDYRSKPND